MAAAYLAAPDNSGVASGRAVDATHHCTGMQK
jgi:hypothetical protein